jgi:hypothetical protein
MYVSAVLAELLLPQTTNQLLFMFPLVSFSNQKNQLNKITYYSQVNYFTDEKRRAAG